MRLLLRTLRSLDPAFCKNVDLDIHDVQFQLCEYDAIAGESATAATSIRTGPLFTALISPRAPTPTARWSSGPVQKVPLNTTLSLAGRG